MWYSPAVLSAKLEYQSSTACPPKPAALQALLPMEPTEVNANHCARLPGGRMSLNEAD